MMEKQESERTGARAVSPVIGVILMVAITVILAAVIGAFVLNIGQSQETVPQATFNFVYDKSANTLTVTHAGGARFTTEDTSTLRVVDSTGTTKKFSLPVSAGQSVTLGSPSAGEVRVIWADPEGQKTQAIATFTIPG